MPLIFTGVWTRGTTFLEFLTWQQTLLAAVTQSHASSVRVFHETRLAEASLDAGLSAGRGKWFFAGRPTAGTAS